MGIVGATLGLLALYFLVRTVAFVFRPRRKHEISWLKKVPYLLLLVTGLGVLIAGSLAAFYSDDTSIITSTISLLIVVSSLIIHKMYSPTN